MSCGQSMQERLNAFHARDLEYRRLGHDRAAAARFIVESAPGLSGPALDVGTGKGLLAIALAQTGLEVVSIDIDAEEQNLARQLARHAGMDGRIRFVHGDAAQLPYPDAHFGCVAMMDVLHHLDKPGPLLREMSRVLKNAGVFVVADFDERGFELVGAVHRGVGREHPRTATTMAQSVVLLERAGLRRLKCLNGSLHDIAVLVKEPRQELALEVSNAPREPMTMAQAAAMLEESGLRRRDRVNAAPDEAASLAKEPGRALVPKISEEPCDGCGICLARCPTGALVEPDLLGCAKCVKYCSVMDVPCQPTKVVLVSGRCDGCGTCASVCPRRAISMTTAVGQSAGACERPSAPPEHQRTTVGHS